MLPTPAPAADAAGGGRAVPGASDSALRVPTVVVSGRPSSGSTVLDAQVLSASRAFTSDSARLLEDVPGVSLYGAGGISSLPAIHGLADDRLRVQVDGMDVMAACANHMNSPVSYINPSRVGRVTVYAGSAPVSVGGDSIGGTVQVDTAPPRFAEPGGALLTRGRAGGFYRSNGHAHGHQLGATIASDRVSLSFDESVSQSANYRAARPFKAPGIGSQTPGGQWLGGEVVGSSAYRGSRNREISLATQADRHLLQLGLGEQSVGFEGFPNQRMDMTFNRNTLVNLRYAGDFDWGLVEARAFEQRTRHAMDMGPDRVADGVAVMPMNSEARTRGASVKASVTLAERHVLRAGAEALFHTLQDWWPPVGVSGAMCCNQFWNIRDGRRDRVGIFSELGTTFEQGWSTLVGLRTDLVRSEAGLAQGYNATGMWAIDARRFNGQDRQRSDRHWDFTALLRQEPDATTLLEAGFARKTRSPNLHERYAWSTQPMAALMNNTAGDGNGYIGNPDLRPETAYTLSLTGDWHDADRERWGFRTTVYTTYVDDYVDARRCDFGQCGGAANVGRTNGFVLLQFANQSAQLYGADVSGVAPLLPPGRLGSLELRGLASYVRGENLSTGDALYHLMPLNAKASLVHRLGNWTSTLEVVGVAARNRVSRVRNEVPTPGYSLVNLRASHQWKGVRLDVGVDNLFDRFYFLPLGGAYLGQGWSMTTNAIPWGVTVPGMGRSVTAAVSMEF
jgi:iron complex outermembrane receptor protein